MAYPSSDAPNVTVRSSATAIWVRDDSPISTALMDRALSAMPSMHQVAQIYHDDKDSSVTLAVRSADPMVAHCIATEFERGLRQASAPGHGGIFVRGGVISDGLLLAGLEANVWAQSDEPMVQAG